MFGMQLLCSPKHNNSKNERTFTRIYSTIKKKEESVKRYEILDFYLLRNEFYFDRIFDHRKCFFSFLNSKVNDLTETKLFNQTQI